MHDAVLAHVISEQNAWKIAKIFQRTAKLCRKLKWLGFFSDTVYIKA